MMLSKRRGIFFFFFFFSISLFDFKFGHLQIHPGPVHQNNVIILLLLYCCL